MKYKLILLGIILIGLSLRLIDIHKNLLWHDEAETVINSLQVLTDGYPNAYFEGQPIYESSTMIPIPIDDPVYKYASSNYVGSKYENNKGWFTYYYLAPWLKIFGWSELSARLPFLLFYILTTILIWLFSQKIFNNKKISLLACLLFSLDFWSILYGRQARYYAPLMFSSLLTIYFNYLYIHNKKNKYLWLTTSALLLTFHIHIIVFLILSIFLIYFDFIKNKFLKIDRVFAWNMLFLLAGIIPWLILVKFWVNFDTHLSKNQSSIKLIWLVLVIIIYICYVVFARLLSKFIVKFKNFAPGYLPVFIIFTLIFTPLFIPDESFSNRAFVYLLPILSILAANILYNLCLASNRQKQYYFFYILVILMLYYGLHFMIPNDLHLYKTTWVKQTLQYTKNNGFQKNDIIITNRNPLTFTLYSEQASYDMLVLRQDFINNYPHRILAVLWTSELQNYNYSEKLELANKFKYCQESSSCIDRLKSCEIIDLDKNVIIFDCPALADNP